MKINKLYLIALAFLFILSSCAKLSEGMTGSKRSKSSDEFLVHKKKPLVLPPDFNDMPLPKPMQKKQIEEEEDGIKDLITITKQSNQNKNLQNQTDKSLENSILKKINKN